MVRRPRRRRGARSRRGGRPRDAERRGPRPGRPRPRRARCRPSTVSWPDSDLAVERVGQQDLAAPAVDEHPHEPRRLQGLELLLVGQPRRARRPPWARQVGDRPQDVALRSSLSASRRAAEHVGQPTAGGHVAGEAPGARSRRRGSRWPLAPITSSRSRSGLPPLARWRRTTVSRATSPPRTAESAASSPPGRGRPDRCARPAGPATTRPPRPGAGSPSRMVAMRNTASASRSWLSRTAEEVSRRWASSTISTRTPAEVARLIGGPPTVRASSSPGEAEAPRSAGSTAASAPRGRVAAARLAVSGPTGRPRRRPGPGTRRPGGTCPPPAARAAAGRRGRGGPGRHRTRRGARCRPIRGQGSCTCGKGSSPPRRTSPWRAASAT